MEKFVIFLDIDGVLVSYDNLKKDAEGNHLFKKEAVEALNQIIAYYNADLVMISSWNVKFPNVFSYALFLCQNGIKVNNLEFGDYLNRSSFICDKIQEGLKHYLIIDDEAQQYYENEKIAYNRILQPNRYRCLDHFDVKQVTINYKLNVSKF